MAHFRPQQGFKEDGHQEWLVPTNAVCLEHVLIVDFIAMLGEYVGTVLFMIFALGGTK
jgi:hypothetical protein